MRVVFLAALLLMPMAGAVDAEGAKAYEFPTIVEDDAGDHKGVGAVEQARAPNSQNPESDIIEVAFTGDAATLVIRVTMATFDFGIGNGFSAIILDVVGPSGQDWEIVGTWQDGGASPGTTEVDTVTGDADVPIPGLTVETIPGDNAVYLLVDRATAGLGEGDKLTLDTMHTGRNYGGRTFFNLDVVDALPGAFVVADYQAAPAPVEEPTTVAVEYLSLFEDQLSHAYDNATDRMFHYNWTTSEANGTFWVDVEATNGSATLILADAAGAEWYNGTAMNHEQAINGSGAWTLQLTYTGFVGNLSLGFAPPGATPLGTPSQTTPGTDDASDSQGNETSAPPGEESPGSGLALLFAAFAVVGVAGRLVRGKGQEDREF